MSNPGTGGRVSGKPLNPKQDKHKNRNKKKKKGRGGLIAIIVIIVLVGTGAALLYWNIYSIRDMVFDMLSRVPVLESIIPEAEGERTPRVTLADMQSRVELLQRQVDSLTRERDSLREENDGLKRETDRLRGFEETQEQSKQDVEAFVNELISDDPMTFWRLFQQMDPDLAVERTREVARIALNAREVREYLTTIGDMEIKAAASAMEILMDTNADMVTAIMNSLATEKRAPILDAMEAEKRAALMRLMYPEGL